MNGGGAFDPKGVLNVTDCGRITLTANVVVYVVEDRLFLFAEAR